MFNQRIKGAQHGRLTAPITKHSEAPTGFVFIDTSQVRGFGDKACDLPTEPVRLLLIAGHHVGRADKGSNSAKPLCVIIAGIALEPVDRYGFRIAKPAATVGNDGARVRKYEVN